MLEIPTAAKMLASAVPFMIVGSGQQQINKTRIVEAIVTAIISGLVIAYAGMYVALPVLMERIEQIKTELRETRQLIRDIEIKSDVKAAKVEAVQAAAEAKIVALQIEQARRK